MSILTAITLARENQVAPGICRCIWNFTRNRPRIKKSEAGTKPLQPTGQRARKGAVFPTGSAHSSLQRRGQVPHTARLAPAAHFLSGHWLRLWPTLPHWKQLRDFAPTGEGAAGRAADMEVSSSRVMGPGFVEGYGGCLLRSAPPFVLSLAFGLLAPVGVE